MECFISLGLPTVVYVWSQFETLVNLYMYSFLPYFTDFLVVWSFPLNCFLRTTADVMSYHPNAAMRCTAFKSCIPRFVSKLTKMQEREILCLREKLLRVCMECPLLRDWGAAAKLFSSSHSPPPILA